MKITIEPTSDQSDRAADMKYSTVVLSLPDDNLNLHDVLEMLITPALIAFGYGFANVVQMERDEDQ